MYRCHVLWGFGCAHAHILGYAFLKCSGNLLFFFLAFSKSLKVFPDCAHNLVHVCTRSPRTKLFQDPMTSSSF